MLVVIDSLSVSEVRAEFVVVVKVEVTTESDRALESAVEIFSEFDAALLSDVVVRVETTTESERALESATEARRPAESALDSATEVLADPPVVPAEVAFESAVEISRL